MPDADAEPAERTGPATGRADSRANSRATGRANSRAAGRATGRADGPAGGLSPVWAAAVGGLVAIVLAAGIAVGANTGPPALAGAAVACLICLGAGWGDALHLPHRTGTGLLLVLLGGAAVLVVGGPKTTERPLFWFPALLAAGVLAAFGHELFRRDGRGELVESVTGTLTGEVLAVLAAGWLLLAGTAPGFSVVLVAVAAVTVTLVAVRLLPALMPAPLAPWAAAAGGPVAAVIASTAVDGVPVLTAIGVGVAVGAVGVVLDRLLTQAPGAPRSLLAVLGSAAAPVAAAGTVAYTVVRIALG